MTRTLGEPSLDPPDHGDLCACCYAAVSSPVEVPKPGGGRWRYPIWVCSYVCRDEYLADYDDYLFDRMNTEDL